MELGMPFLLETATLEDACALAGELGLQFVELNMNFPQCGLEQLDAKRLNELKRQYGLYFTIHLDENLNPFEFNPMVRKAWLDTVSHAIRIAKEIDAPILNMHLCKGVFITLPDRKTYLYSKYGQAYQEAGDALAELCEQELSQCDSFMLIENTGGFAPHEQRMIDRLLESPRFGLTLDVGHSLCAGDMDMPFYMERIDRLRHMHLHDAKGTHCHLALGDGVMDIGQKLTLAREHNARIVLETKTIETLRASVRRLAQWR